MLPQSGRRTWRRSVGQRPTSPPARFWSSARLGQRMPGGRGAAAVAVGGAGRRLASRRRQEPTQTACRYRECAAAAAVWPGQRHLLRAVCPGGHALHGGPRQPRLRGLGHAVRRRQRGGAVRLAGAGARCAQRSTGQRRHREPVCNTLHGRCVGLGGLGGGGLACAALRAALGGSSAVPTDAGAMPCTALPARPSMQAAATARRAKTSMSAPTRWRCSHTCATVSGRRLHAWAAAACGAASWGAACTF